jgi:outer membrane protein TolC
LSPADIQSTNRADAQAARAGVAPIEQPLTIEEAMARALKHNLDRRSRLMEEALARRQFDASSFDMLPKLLATAGYDWRNNDKISNSRAQAGGPVQPGSISQDRDHTLAGLEFSWSLLDFSLGYYGARQQGDRLFIAGERRRKAMHLLMQDVRTVYWRAAAAQRLADSVKQTIDLAEVALADSRSACATRSTRCATSASCSRTCVCSRPSARNSPRPRWSCRNWSTRPSASASCWPSSRRSTPPTSRCASPCASWRR